MVASLVPIALTASCSTSSGRTRGRNLAPQFGLSDVWACIRRQRMPRWIHARPPEPMTDEDLEDFLTEAIGLYVEQTKTPVSRMQTFEEAGLLLKNRGLVIGIGGCRQRRL